ncbi:hypothetical protein ABZ915_47645 [Streptomyces sp. NPDC046915]|uniref:hypothetical protein n=1 Tax=Streptomyces sp. NPDC046915 TaxID=3155257 RepID=UPI0033DD7BC5
MEQRRTTRPPQTQLGYWALNTAAKAGLHADYGVELGERDEDGNYEVTLIVPIEEQWEAAKLIMSLLSHRTIEVVTDRATIRVKTQYPNYLGDPTGPRIF